MKPFVSIIVPAYNVEHYIKKCIESIIHQSYHNVEIILVDDGSEDNTGIVCDGYSERFPQINVIHKANGGLVAARKTGLKAASGIFVCWVDADDWIESDYIDNLVRAQKISSADIVAAAHYHDIGGDSRKICNNFPEGTYLRKELLQRLIYSGVFFEYGLQPHLCNKLIKRTILEKTQINVSDRINAGEDAAVLYPSVLEAERICVTDICGYHYVQHLGSITKSRSTDEAERLKLLFEHLEHAFKENGIEKVFENQMLYYKKYMFLMRQMDCYEGQYPFPYGEDVLDGKVILYGAGGLGQKLYTYMNKCGRDKVVAWVDQNWSVYNKSGLRVEPPKNISNYEGKYQYILIANISCNTAKSIKEYLLDMGVNENKIRWFSEKFLSYESDYEPGEGDKMEMGE